MPALHLQHMGDGVRAPEVARIELDRGAAGASARRVVAALLVRRSSGRTASCRSPAGRALQCGNTRSTEARIAPARPSQKLLKCVQAEGQHVVRMLGEDLLPDAERAVEVAVDPARPAPSMCARSRVRGVRGERARGLQPPRPPTGTFACL